MDNIRDIVNGAQLSRFVNKKVSILGHVTEVASNSLSFDMRTVDNVIVKINLKRPLTSPLEGYVEVIGTSQGKTVLADDFIIFNNEKMDVKSHNTLCQLLYTVPNIWSTS
ncbi:uncharacterized protein LOC109605276 [Aethina tumida]|uniref:uncharacterized protein LOC109605276 n=1 Tax=Aethina tumida TaxID=116153 RepID=UPI00096ADA5A|nr:uncharacterized protein LOC109605276 [Aethina tumida]